ncbi:MAG: hypothetical protein J7639_11830 [Paenibacillaceae bacterium]|nr:hypothetical protein [Paenibacillaceae bacterium]
MEKRQRSPLFSGFPLGSYRSKNPENKKRSEYRPLRAAGAVSPDVRRLVAGCLPVARFHFAAGGCDFVILYSILPAAFVLLSVFKSGIMVGAEIDGKKVHPW